MNDHWYIIASQNKVKVFEEVLNKKKLKVVKIFKNPLGRVRSHELIKKQAGRGVKSSGRMGAVHYSETKRHDPHEEAAKEFANQISNFLDLERQKSKFKFLSLAAEPKFLGKLKAAMGKRLEESVVEWINKDLEKAPQEKILQRFFGVD